jgi:hypothetical protein
MSNHHLSEAKSSLAGQTYGENEISDSDPSVSSKGGTAQDGNDMHRMGKLQQLRACVSFCLKPYRPPNLCR